jgi:hypothetical protein
LSLAEAFSLFLTSLRIILESVSCIVEIWWPHTIAPIREACVTHTTHLTDTYDKDSLSTVYKDWKEVQSIRFISTQHLGPVFEKLNATYSHLNGVYLKGLDTLMIQPQLQALMMLVSLPKGWEEIVMIIMSQTPFPDLKPSMILSKKESQKKV